MTTYRLAFPGKATPVWDEYLAKAFGTWGGDSAVTTMRHAVGGERMTDVRLAVAEHSNTAEQLEATLPSVRFAVSPRGGVEDTLQQAAPAVRVASHWRLNHCGESLEALRPAFLTSFVFLRWFQQRRDRLPFRDWVLDSGAFSAKNSGTEIRAEEYVETCKELLATDPQLTEVFALDVIGDWRASLKNCEASWKAGVPAIPTFHVGSPEDALLTMARDYPKIALGGAVGYRRRGEWAARCFARVWPKPIHGFGFGEGKIVLSLPFHSVDCSSWASPFRYGNWQSMGGVNLGIRGTRTREIGIRVEFEHYARLERRAQAQWGRHLAALNYTPLRIA